MQYIVLLATGKMERLTTIMGMLGIVLSPVIALGKAMYMLGILIRNPGHIEEQYRKKAEEEKVSREFL